MTRSQEQELLKALRVDIDQIDDLVSLGHYTSRADFLRMAVEKLLTEHRYDHAEPKSWRYRAAKAPMSKNASDNMA